MAFSYGFLPCFLHNEHSLAGDDTSSSGIMNGPCIMALHSPHPTLLLHYCNQHQFGLQHNISIELFHLKNLKMSNILVLIISELIHGMISAIFPIFLRIKISTEHSYLWEATLAVHFIVRGVHTHDGKGFTFYRLFFVTTN